MTETVDVPEDVRKAAEALWIEASNTCAPGDVFSSIDLIVKGMLLERETCAKVAVSLADDYERSASELRGNMRDYRLHRASGVRHLAQILRTPRAVAERLAAIRSQTP